MQLLRVADKMVSRVLLCWALLLGLFLDRAPTSPSLQPGQERGDRALTEV
jgi:hypothetical protein